MSTIDSTTILLPSANNSAVRRKEPMVSDSLKKNLNLSFNGLSAGMNLASCGLANFGIENSFTDVFNNLTQISTRCATGAQGAINATIAYEKKSLISMAGALLELPISGFAPWYELFLARGVSAGLNQYESMIESIPIKNYGKQVKDSKGNKLFYKDFTDVGWWQGVKLSLGHIPELTKELFKTPFKKEGLFPRLNHLCSAGMIAGPLIFPFLPKVGAPVRDFFGSAEAIALMTHSEKEDPNSNKENRPKKMKFSNYSLSGIVWTLGGISDFAKRVPFIGERVQKATEFSLFLDRIGAIFFILGNQGDKREKPATT